MTKTDIKLLADVVVPITIEDAKRLPGLLGRTVPVKLQYTGYATVNVAGRKTFYEVIK